MSQMVQMYHPNISSTVTNPVEVALQSVDDHAARGWLLVDPDEELPTPATPYYTTAAADSRFVRGTQLATKMAEHVGDGSAFDLAQRAASVAAVAEDIDDPGTAIGAAAGAFYATREVARVGHQYVSMHDNPVATIAADLAAATTEAAAAATDDQAAWNAVLASITAPGVTLTWRGKSKTGSLLNWKTGVSLVGEGMAASALVPTHTGSAIQRGGSTAAPLTDCSFVDFEVDGSLMPGPTGKAFFITYMLRPTWRNLHIHGTPSTGLGCDFLRDYLIDNVTAEGCGRLGLITDLGCAGIGIGTGAWAEEAGIVRNSRTRNNKRAGLFFEKQSFAPYFSRGVKVIGHEAEGNLFGIGDQGVEGMEVIGGRAFGNAQDGLYVAASNAGALGIATRVRGLETYGNGRHGVMLDAGNDGNATPAYRGRYDLDVDSHDNASVGFKVSINSSITDLRLRLRAARNGNIGLDVTGGTLTRADVDALIHDSTGAGIRFLSAINGGRYRLRSGDTRTSGRTQTYGLDAASATITDAELDGEFFNNITGPATFGTLAGRTRFRELGGYLVRAGSPEGVVVAPVGTEYTRTDGTAGTIKYLKTSGAGNTGWAAIA